MFTVFQFSEKTFKMDPSRTHFLGERGIWKRFPAGDVQQSTGTPVGSMFNVREKTMLTIFLIIFTTNTESTTLESNNKKLKFNFTAIILNSTVAKRLFLRRKDFFTRPFAFSVKIAFHFITCKFLFLTISTEPFACARPRNSRRKAIDRRTANHSPYSGHTLAAKWCAWRVHFKSFFWQNRPNLLIH